MRKYYLDNLRWAAVVLVVVYHVFYMYNAEGVLGGLGKITDLSVQYYDLYMYIVYPWLMPLLFLISGASARYALERQTPRAFIKSRTQKLLVPSTLGLFAFQFVQGYVSMSLADAFNELAAVPGFVKYLIMVLSGSGVLWYAQLLYLFSLLLVLLRRVEKDRLWVLCARTPLWALLLLALPLYLCAQVLNAPVITVYRFGLYFALFLCGYFLLSHDAVVEKLKKAFYPLLGAAALLGVSFCLVCFGQNYADAPVNKSPLFVLYGYTACLAIFGGAARRFDFANGFTRWMHARSFGLYVFHYLGISLVALLLAKPQLLPPLPVYLLSLAAGFAVGYGLNALISRIPVFRYLVLGIRKER